MVENVNAAAVKPEGGDATAVRHSKRPVMIPATISGMAVAVGPSMRPVLTLPELPASPVAIVASATGDTAGGVDIITWNCTSWFAAISVFILMSSIDVELIHVAVLLSDDGRINLTLGLLSADQP